MRLGPDSGISRVIVALLALLLAAQPLIASVGAAEEQLVIGECRLPVAAVASGGGGVIGFVSVKVVYPGSGRVYLSTSPATEIDTQGAARLAAFAAALTAGVDFSRYDYFVDLESSSVIVGGPSAGLPMALATLAALLGLDCRGPGFVATGMMLPDGSVGPVGGLKEKLQAAAEWGATLFIVPKGQLVYRDYERVTERIGPLVIVRTVPVEVDLARLGAELGVEVVEAGTLADAAQKAFGLELGGPQAGAPSQGLSVSGLEGVYASLEGEYEALKDEASQAPTWLAQLVDTAEALHGEASRAAGEGLYMASILLDVEALSLLETASWLAAEAQGGDWSLREQVDQVKGELEGVVLGGDESDVVASVLLWRASMSLAQAMEGLGEGYTVPRTILGINLEPVVQLARALWLARAAQLVSGLEWPEASYPGERLAALLGLASDSIAYALALAGEDGGVAEAAAAALKSASAAEGGAVKAGLAAEAAGLALAAVAAKYGIDPGHAAALAAGASQDHPGVTALLQVYQWAAGSGDERLAAEAAYAALLLSWLSSPAPQTPEESAGGKAGQPGEAPATGHPEGGSTPQQPQQEPGDGYTEPAQGLTVVAALVVAVASLLAGAALASRLLGGGG